MSKVTKRSDGKRGRSAPFTRAFESVARVMREDALEQPEDDSVRRTREYHLGGAEQHVRRLHEGGQRQDHLSHAATRPLMALPPRGPG
jgi:hypothetical protein